MQHLLLSEIGTSEICKMFVYKYTETIEHAKHFLTQKKNANFTGK